MIDVNAPGFKIDAIDLSKVTAADIAPLQKHHTDEDWAAWGKLHLAAKQNGERAEASANAAAEREKVNATVKARCDAIHALTPRGAEQLSYAAMRDGTSVEQFKEIIAGWQREQVAAADEAAAQAILSTFHLFHDQSRA